MKYRKLPVQVKIEPVTEKKTINTLEGSQEISVGQYLVTGVKNELYAISKEVFYDYTPVDGREGYYEKVSNNVVEAFQLTNPITVERPDGVHAGKVGDYFINNNGDQYVCDREVFLETYVSLTSYQN